MIIITRIGNTHSIIEDNSQPLKNANANPDALIANDKYIYPIFSPNADYIVLHYKFIFYESSSVLLFSTIDIKFC